MTLRRTGIVVALTVLLFPWSFGVDVVAVVIVVVCCGIGVKRAAVCVRDVGDGYVRRHEGWTGG